MLRLYVDYNFSEEHDVIVLRLDIPANAHISERELSVGEHILLFDEGDEYEAILGHGQSHVWVAKIIPETNRVLTEK